MVLLGRNHLSVSINTEEVREELLCRIHNLFEYKLFFYLLLLRHRCLHISYCCCYYY